MDNKTNTNFNNKNISSTNKKPTGLGKGLSALLGGSAININTNNVGNNINDNIDDSNKIIDIDINLLVAGKYQPRGDFKDEKLQELSISIQQKGVLQPILVRKIESNYEIVAGERRWRASKLAGLKTIPAILVNYTDKEVLEVGLIENLQRENLNPIEEALGFEQLIKEFNYTHNELSVVLGKDRSYITNYLRILSLSAEVQHLIRIGKISVGHAKIIVNYEYPIELAEKIINENLSVRETENLAKQYKKNKDINKTIHNQEDNELIDIVNDKLNKVFTGFNNEIKMGKNGSGYIKIKFNNKDQLKNILNK
ncbi:ParB/RepB/Spo0J family partition protein [Rickettsiales bacterium LUAb2]